MVLGAAWAVPGALAPPPDSMMVMLRPPPAALLPGWARGATAWLGRCLTGAVGAMSVTHPPCWGGEGSGEDPAGPAAAAACLAGG